jgi:folate-binding protein YgfZ
VVNWLQWTASVYRRKNKREILTLFMIFLNYLNLLRVSGEDASDFLHGQLAADTACLKLGDACFAAYCSPRGQVIALLLVMRRESDWLIACEASLFDAVLKRFRMFVMRAKVEINTVHDLQLAGLSTGQDDSSPTASYHPGIGALAYLPLNPGTNDQEEVTQWQQLEVEKGVTWLNTNTSERFLPQMLGLERIGAVSFTKGCYPGQEIVARTRYLGKLKRKPLLLTIDGQPSLQPGENCELLAGEKTVDAVIIEIVEIHPGSCRLILVTPLGEDESVATLRHQQVNYPATRLEFS